MLLLLIISPKIFILDHFLNITWPIPQGTSKVFENVLSKMHRIEHGQSLETISFLYFTMPYLCDITRHEFLCLYKGTKEGPVRYYSLSNVTVNGLRVPLRWYLSIYLYILKVTVNHYLCIFFLHYLFCSLFF